MANIALVAVLLLVIAVVGAYALSGGFRDWNLSRNDGGSNAPNDDSPSNLPGAPSGGSNDQSAGSDSASSSGSGSESQEGSDQSGGSDGSSGRSDNDSGASNSSGSGFPGGSNEQASGGSGSDDGTGTGSGGSGTTNDSGDEQAGNGNQSNGSGQPAVGTVSVSGYGAERTVTGNQTMFYMMLYVQMPSVAAQPDPAVTRTVLSINGTTYENPELVYPRVGSGSCMAYVRVPDSAYLPGAPYTLTGYNGDQIVVTASGAAPD